MAARHGDETELFYPLGVETEGRRAAMIAATSIFFMPIIDRTRALLHRRRRRVCLHPTWGSAGLGRRSASLSDRIASVMGTSGLVTLEPQVWRGSWARSWRRRVVRDV